MTDALVLQERVRNAIQIGESDYREFKSAQEGPPNNKKPRSTRDICRDIGEALVAFANADGGELLVGVEDDGTISGVPHGESDISRMLDAPKTHVYPGNILPISHAVKLDIDGKIVLFFAAAKGSTEIYQLPDGRCVRRKGSSTVPEAVKKIVFDRQEVRSREYDRQFVDGAQITDLDLPFIQSIADRYLKGLTVEKYLQQIGLAEYAVNGLRLRMAAVLLFAGDIQRWHPRSQVRILKVAGTQLKSGEQYNVLADETVRGNIFELLQSSWEQLRPFLAEKTEFGVDAKFEEKYIYPEWACREALINAIAHRDYSIQNGIEVFIFADRMEIKSPGALLSTLTIKDLEKLEGAHESRNVLIARVLRENKFMRELGEGIKRMFESMEQVSLDKPVLYSNSLWFSVTLLHKSIFKTKHE
jgi:ATP-dependent DNA helicase RecG